MENGPPRRPVTGGASTVHVGDAEPIGAVVGVRIDRDAASRSGPSLQSVTVTAGFGVVTLVGREDELAFLGSALEHAAGGSGTVVLLDGEAGIGKSRLLHEAVHAPRQGAFQVLHGVAGEMERTRPFGVIAEAFGVHAGADDPARADIARLLVDTEIQVTPGRMAETPDLRYSVVEALVELGESLAYRGPVAVVLDDLQWADSSSLLAIAVLARRLEHLPVAILATFRPPRPSSELERAVSVLVERGARHVRLSSLVDTAVASIAGEVLGASPGPALRAELGRARGNPLFVIELLLALGEEGLLSVDEGGVEVGAFALSPNLRVTLLRRLNHLRPRTLELLRLASVLGSSFELAQLRNISGQSVTELMGGVEESLAAGVLDERGDRVAFRHDLLREAIYEDIPRPLRAGLHLQTGWALAEAGAAALEVAHHLSLGASPGEPEAVEWLQRAAAEALPRAPSVAVELLEAAAGLTASGSASSDALDVDLVSARLWAGRLPEAELLARQVLARGPAPPLEAAVRNILLLALLGAGRAADAQQEAEMAFARLARIDAFTAQLGASLAHARAFMGDFAGAAEAARQAVAAGERSGDDLAVCEALCALSSMAWLEGSLLDGVDLAQEAVSRADCSATRAARRFHCRLFLAGALMEIDRFAESATALHEGLLLSEEVGSPWNLSMYHVGLAWLHLYTGQWDDCLVDVQTARSLAEEFGSGHGSVSAQALVAMIHLYRGQLGEAAEAVAAGDAALAARGPEFRCHWLGWASALLQEASGNPEQALETLGTSWSLCQHVNARSELPILGPDMVRLCLAARDPTRARAVADQTAEVADGMSSPSAHVAALRCQGLATTDADVLLRAATLARGVPRPLLRAATSHEAGNAMAAAGRRDEAITLLKEAVDAYGNLGASRSVRAVEVQLRELGIRRGARGSRPRRPTTGWDSLTATETRVVDLVVDGLTNRQVGQRLFLSARTVETHLSHVFAKLGLSSRAQLTAAAARRRAGAVSHH